MASKRDYYEILGVPRNADQEQIKKAYRKAALDNHPDRHAGNKQAEQRFKEAAEAYSVLSDQEKRGRYDRFGHAAVDGAGGGAGFNNADDVFAAFSDLFGGGGRLLRPVLRRRSPPNSSPPRSEPEGRSATHPRAGQFGGEKDPGDHPAGNL